MFRRCYITAQGKMTDPKMVGDAVSDEAGISAALTNDGDQLSIFCRGFDTAQGTGRHYWASGDLAQWNWQVI